ncbi:hypothetical protein [Hymenobacter sp. BT559]|uniref:hypothetical protein n=1 Tax=Hymenobacter sp. BT559 TaxID=2795729 RepID=UPI0018EE2712|nr:hypothetical protein [Hymenobacter sp. BT559]MBJ6141768.1 hypothetical protein [Hymenobacter sp. BT559]
MKKPLLITGLLLVALLLTNPHLADHKEALLEKEMQELPAAGLGLDAGSPLVVANVRSTIERRAGRKDYWLFSLTTLNYSDALIDSEDGLLNRTVGIGILGRVFLWSKM